MTWFGWFLIGYWAANALGSIALIGHRRDPITPGVAVALVILYGLLAWGVATVSTGTP